jgi:glyceraldehyde 3-phosphate dehydrogenase
VTIKVGINGFGRIGRLVYRAMEADPAVEVVAVNDLTDAKTLAHLLKYDSVHGRFGKSRRRRRGRFLVDGHARQGALRARPGRALPWGSLGVDVVVESTGIFTDANKAKAHIDAGAKKVLISAPAKNEDITIVLGVNDDEYDADEASHRLERVVHHELLSRPWPRCCATSSVSSGLHEHHPQLHQRPGDARPAAQGPAPGTFRCRVDHPDSTGAAKAIGLVMPDMKGKLDGMSMRVPTPDGSVVDLVAELERDVTADEINAAMKAAAEGPMKGYPRVLRRPDRLGRRRRQPGLLGLRLAADDGHGRARQLRQVRVVVRQRVGLQRVASRTWSSTSCSVVSRHARCLTSTGLR